MSVGIITTTIAHDVGDDILRELTRVVSEYLRHSDSLIRWGGEEIMVFLPGTDRESAAHIAERLRSLVAETSFPGPDRLTISLGVAEYQKGESLKDLVTRVDDALYAAKAKGRNNVVKG